MMRIVTVAVLAAFAGLSFAGTTAQAQSASSTVRVAQAAPSADPAYQRRKPLRRVPIYRNDWEPNVYPRYNPGPNAVRDCTATYVQEYRPSGTVITPRMNCTWRPG